MPADNPVRGEVWSTQSFEGNTVLGCVVAVSSDGDAVLLASQTGRTSTLPIRSMLLMWRIARTAPVPQEGSLTLCEAQNCQEVSFIRQRLPDGNVRHVCHRHISSGQPTFFPGDDPNVVSDITVQPTVPRDEFPQGPSLDNCPACGTPLDRVRVTCPTCTAHWQTIDQRVPPTRLGDAVSQARRRLRLNGHNANYLRMDETTCNLVVLDNSRVPERNADDETILITRGTIRGGGLMFAGLPVVVAPGPVTLVAATRENIVLPTGETFLRLSDYIAFAHFSYSGSGRVLDRLGHHVGSERITVPQDTFEAGFRPVADVAPPRDSLWRNPNQAGSYATVISHGQDLGQPYHVVLSDESGVNTTMPLRNFIRDFIRFDLSDLPAVGSVWTCRGTGAIVAIAEVAGSGADQHVVTRNADGQILRMLIPDLWRNYTPAKDYFRTLECNIGEEWVNQKGESFEVVLLDRDLGIATLVSAHTGVRVQVTARAFVAGGTWTKVERTDALDKLTRDDPFGWGDADAS